MTHGGRHEEPNAPQPRRRPRQTRIVPKGRLRRVLRLAIRLLVVGIVSTVVYAAAFVGVRCFSSEAPSSSAASPGPETPPGSHRPESFTYLTLPEWFIVYSADEYAAFLTRERPSRFPYLRSAQQYWSYYGAACGVTKQRYPFETGYHLMLGVIGVSFTVENGLKFMYENTVGRLTERLSSIDTHEDALARRTAGEYGAFMHTSPWYEFAFADRLQALWVSTPWRGPHQLRKLERRFALTLEYGAKALYGWLVAKASGAAYGAEEQRIHARIEHAPASIFAGGMIRQVRPLGAGAYLVTLPRYEAFTGAALALTALGVRFIEIAGNDEILITALARRGVSSDVPHARLIAARPVLTDPTMQRLALSVEVRRLPEVAAHLARERAVIEHLYDY